MSAAEFPQTVIMGAGGHAKVIIDILEETGGVNIRGCVLNEPNRTAILKYPVLGTDDDLPALFADGATHAFVAVGDNRLRKRLVEKVRGFGYCLINAISPRAIISPRASIAGEGIAVMPGAILNVDTKLSTGVIVNTGASLDHDCDIAPFAHIAPGCSLAGCVDVGEGAFLGTGTKVIPQIRIGQWATIGAGSVVVRDIAPYSWAKGVPATVYRKDV